MKVRDARLVAATWVTRHGRPDPAFRGAFLTGSTTALAPDEVLPETSDVDLTVLLADTSSTPTRPGKRRVDGVLLEVTYRDAAAFADPVRVARSFVYAPSFRGGHVLADPTGHLARLTAEIAPGFATPAAVRARVDDVRHRIRTRLAALDPAAAWADVVQAWLFPTSLTAVEALVAALRMPTVRLRYLRARAVLAPAAYEELLALLGCARCDADLVVRHLDATAERFEEAAALLAAAGSDPPPFPFAADLTPDARPVAIDGSRALMADGDHREAVFWVVATAARCQAVLDAHAPASARRREPAFRELVADLTGVATPADALARRDALLATLP